MLAGIYLSGGTLYLDGTGIFDVVENYSYVANFLTFVIGAIELGGNNGGGNENNPTEGEEGQGPATQALAAAAAVSAAEGDETVVRDALINLIYSDTAMQIVITKSIISSLLAALVPDLGSIADIFDSFEVSLGVDIGRHDYVKVKSATYTAKEDVNGKYIAIKNNGGDIVGFMLADGSEEPKYTLTPATEATGATEDLRLYYQAKDGNFYIADGMRYRWVKEEQFVKANGLDGAYVKVLVDGSEEYLYRDDYVFYTEQGGNYTVVTDLADVAAGTTVYVRVAGSYIEVSSGENGIFTYDREYGYVRDAKGDLLRVYHPYTDLDEFYLSLGAEVGSMRVGLSLGGIGLEFGRTKSIVPAYITAGKTKNPTTWIAGENNYTYDEATGTYTLVPETEKGEGAVYYQDFPLMPFYDSVVTVGASVELELAITEGNVDIGQIFSSILGDLEGLVIQIPSTNKGYSSAHLRLDLTLVLDAFDLPSSEIMIELYNLSSESGAEVRWLAANYFNEMLYIDLSFFGLPKLAVPMTEIADMLRDLIGDLLDSSIYQDVEVGGASAEAITADDSASTENDMISTEDKVAALLISKRKLAISIGNAMMRYLLTLLTIGDDPLNMLIYEQLKGGLDVTIDLNKGFDVGIGAELMLEGDRYEFVQVDLETEGERFFVFESADLADEHDEGLFLYDSATDSYREASRSEINAVKDGTSTDTLFVRYEAEKVGENWVYYTYTHTGTDTDKWFFDEATDSYVEVKAADDGTGTPAVTAPKGATMYTKEAIDADGKVIYRFKAGAGANPNDYDTVLTLDVNVGAIDMYFTEEREFTLSKEELEDFYEFNGLDTVSLSETISLGLLFADKEEIDLAAVLEYFFPDSDFTAIIGVDSGHEEINNILRDIDITVSLEFKLGAFVNYLRSLAARYDLSYEDEAEDGKKIRVALESLTGDIDLITFINVIRSLIGAKKVPNADGSIYYTDPNVDDLFGLDDILNFVNASVEIATVSNDGVPAHTMLGVYYSLGDNEGTAYADYKGSVTPARYSHYFASEDGIYGYVGVDADTTDGENDGYMLIDDITGYDEEVHGRYSRDNSFLYPDANGDRVREYAGLYVDLSYFGQPGVYINIGEMLALVGGWMGGEMSISLSEAVTAADETTEGSEGTESSFSLPYDLGTLFGGDVNLSDSLPLLSEEIASYITAFVYGARITSTYIRILVESDFLTQILTLLTGGPIFDEDLAFEQSYVGINVDFNNYLYAYLATATTEQIEFSDTRFAIERDDVDGMYWIYTDPLTGEQIMQLRSDMTAAEIADYEAAGKYGYYNITPIETYLHVGGDYVLSSEATNTDWVRAERYTDAGDLGNGYLIGTYKFYVKAGTTYAGEDSNGDGYAEFGADAPIFVVYPSENMKPLVEANIWLWGHNLSLDIHTPVTSAAKFSYTEVTDKSGQYVAEERVVYEPAEAIVGDGDAANGRDYIYYRGSYYPINTGTLLRYDSDNGYTLVGASGWSAFKEAYPFKDDPIDGRYFVEVYAEDDGIIVYVPVKAADLYTEKVYDTVYRYVGETGGDYVRNATTSLVTVPEYRVYVDNVIDDFDIAAGENEDTTFVYHEETGRYVSVADAREEFFNDLKGTYDTDGDGVVDADKEGEFEAKFSVNLAENYKTVTNTEGDTVVVRYGADDATTFVYDEETLRGVSVAAAREAYAAVASEYADFNAYLVAMYGDEDGNVAYYDGTEILYGDTGELYYIDVAIRGSISLSQHVAYLTKGEWEAKGFGNVPGDDEAYVLVRGEYVKYDAAKHGGMTKYYAHTASSSAVSEVLGAILGDMDALFTVADGYKAVLPFEIRATVKIAYPSETDDHFYVAGLELAIDLWRTEADDDTLTHILGLYYKSEQLNINDNDDSNDSTESAGLYLDLSWILGPSAKVKVDLSDYTLEDLLSGVLKDLLKNEESGEGGEGGSEAVTATEGADVGDPDGVTVLLNLYSRKLALQASAGFLKLVIGLLAPDISSTLDEMMPNVSVGVDINAAPYDLTIGATLYDEKGTGLLDLGITLNLFGTSDPSTGLQLGFGAKEDYDEVAAGQLASILAGNPGGGNNDYIYYHALYSRATADEVNNASDDSTFYVTTPGKEYKAIDVATAKGIVDRGGTVYKLDDGTEYIPFSDAKARDESLASGYVGLDERYAAIPITTNNGRPSNNSYVQLQSAEDYKWARDNGLTVYYLRVSDGSDGTYTTTFNSVSIPTDGTLKGVTARNAVKFFNYDGTTDGTGKLYIRVSNAYNKEGFAERFNESTLGVDPLAASATYYLPDGNGTYIKSDVFGNYSTLLSLDLGTLLDDSTGDPDAPEHEHTYNDEGICTVCGAKKIDFLGLILEGIDKAGVETVEIGASLALDLTFSDALNWTRQMSELMAVDGSADNYFAMLLSSMAMNSAEFVSAIGLDIDLALQLQLGGLLEALPGLINAPEGSVDIMGVLPTILRGAKIYLEIAIDTNFYGDDIETAAPIQLWVEISDTDEPFLNIYLIAPDLGKVTDIAPYDENGELIEAIGDFFAQGIKIENMISLADLLASTQEQSDGDNADNSAVTAADSGIIIDIGNKNTGLLPEDIWGILDLLLGEVLFAHDMLSVGLAEDILAGLIGAAVPEFDQLHLLPTFNVKGGSTGANILFGDGSLGLQVQLGINGGFDDYVSYDELVKALDGKSSNAALNGMLADEKVYGIKTEDDLKKFIGTLRVTASTDEDGNTIYTEGGNDVIITTAEYGLASYVSPEKVWLGTRYELTGIDADGKPDFTPVPYNESYTVTHTVTTGEGATTETVQGAFTQNNAGDYVRVSAADVEKYPGLSYYEFAGESKSTYENKFMPIEAYMQLTGEEESAVPVAQRYTLDASMIKGEYVALADINLTLELGDLGVAVNRPFSAENEDIYGFASLIPSATAGAETSGIRLHTEIELGFWGNNGAAINAGELVDMILGIDAIKDKLGDTTFVGTNLALNVVDDFGSKDEPYFTVELDAYFDFTGELQVELQVMRGEKPILGVILAGDGIYIDLTGVLGAGVRDIKAKISNLGITELLTEALGGVFGGAVASGEAAVTASISSTAGMTLHDYAYLAAAINPGYFSLQLTLAAVNAILAKVSADNPDVAIDFELPDLGDIRIESFGDRADGSLLSLGFKMSEDFGVSLDIVKLYIGTEKLYTSDEITNTLDKEYKPIFDVATGEISDDFTLSATANLNIAMTSEGLVPPVAGEPDTWGGAESYAEAKERYDGSLAGWVIGLLTDMLGSTGFFVSAYDPSDTEYNKYGGPIYIVDEAETEKTGSTVYTEVGKVEENGKGYYAKTADGYATTVTPFESGVQYYRTTMIEATFASGAVDLGIEIEADINLGAIIASGIGGILFSDLRVAVTLGAPFNTTILEVYYLGSSRLVKTGNVYDLRAGDISGDVQAFSDAIYIDASGLGLGKIKFQGIAGLLGANVGHAYEAQNASGAISAAEGDETGGETGGEAQAGETVSVTLGIDLAEDYIGINIDKALINTVFGMLGETLEKAGIASLPDVQDLKLALTFGESTVESIELSTTLDAAGTGAIISISDIQLALEPAVDTEDLVGKVKTQFAGITYSKTAGVMTLLQSLINGISPTLSLNVDKRGDMLVQATSNTPGNTLEARHANKNSTISLTTGYGYINRTGDGMEALGGTTTMQGFVIELSIAARHPYVVSSTPDYGEHSISTMAYFGNNNLVIADLSLEIQAGGLAGWILQPVIEMLGLFNWIDLGSVIGSGQLFPSFAYGDDRDTGSWDYGSPVATTSSEGAYTSADETQQYYGEGLKTNADGSVVTDRDGIANGSVSLSDANAYERNTADTNVDAPYKWTISEDGTSWTSGYSYGGGDIMSILNGLISKVEVNLFNRNGYQPYTSNMTAVAGGTPADTDASLISVKVELSKDGYNELMIFLYTMLLSLLHVSVDINGTTDIVEEGGSSDGAYFDYEGTRLKATSADHHRYWYFAYNGWVNETDGGLMLKRHDPSSSGNPGRYVISNIFREIDSVDYMNDLTPSQKTQRKVAILQPYAKSLPFGLLMWLLLDMIALGNMGAPAGQGLTSGNYGALFNALESAKYTLGDLTLLIGSLLPTFASYDSDAPNPSLNIYIDLDPQAAMYGFNDGREVTPGIQAIELMVNAEKATLGGKTLNGINDSGAAAPGVTFGYGATDTLAEAYVLSINPHNLVTANGDTSYSGKGLFSLLEAGRLASAPNIPVTSITVDDVGSKHATVTKTDGSTVTGTLNADLLLNAGLPTEASVGLIGVGSSESHTVPLTWDAGALDFSPAALEQNNRLAGYVYGYALNLVVGMIPVYVTDDQAFTGVYEVSGGGKGAEVTIDWESGKALPEELVYIGLGENGYVFGTQLTDAEGNGLTAVLRKSDGSYETNDAGTYNIYPLYTALAVDSDGNGVLDQVNLGGVDYYIIDAALSGGVLPVGTFSWDLNGLDYGWDGMNGDRKPSVTINYQWGFSATQSEEVTLDIKSKRIEDGTVDGASTLTFNDGRTTRFSDWTTFVQLVGSDGSQEKIVSAIEAYFEGISKVSGTYVGGDAFSDLTIADWDLTSLTDVVASRAGRELSVNVTMYVGGAWNVWREFGYTDIGSQLEYVRGFGDSYLLSVDGKWVYPTIEQAYERLGANNVNNRGMITGVAQPVTVTVTIGEQGDFEWSPTVSGGDDVTPDTPDTYSFSDGSATVLNGGVQTYEITTAAQLYGAMPESGSVVHSDGTTKRAAFDWNGFAYDTDSALNVARLSVTSGGDRIDTDVVVTLADNADVQDAASALDAEPATEATPVTVVAPKLRAMSIDPLVYGTLADFITGTGRPALPYDKVVNEETGDTEHVKGGTLQVKLAGGTKDVTVVSWSDKLASDAALPLAGARYTDNIATFEDADGNLYQAVVPIIVNARVIEDAKVLLGEGFKLVSQTRRFAETVRRYVADGQVIEVFYSRDTHLPTGITVMNPYAYNRDTVFGEEPKLEITFADGYVATYPFTLTGVTAPKYGDESATSTAKWSAGTLNGTLEFMFSALRITGANMLSDIAYGDLDDVSQDFAPYKDMYMGEKLLPTPFGVDNGKEQLDDGVTVYIDGMLVLASELGKYTGTAEGMDAPRYTELKGDGTDAKVYRYNADGTYNEQGKYVYVYAAKHTFKQSELTWDNSGISYNYNGGVRRTTVKIHAGGKGGLEGAMTMPINIVSGRIKSLSFVNAGDDSAPDYSAYFEGNTEGESNTKGAEYFAKHWKPVGEGEVYKLVFDPFEADSTGSAYDIDAAFKTHTEADGSVVIDSYLYFPMKADVVTASDAVIKGAAITWSNLGAIRNSYVGGEFSARITLAALTGEQDKDGNEIQAFGTQGSTIPFVSVTPRNIVSDADTAVFNGTLPTDGKVVKEGEGTQTYIDPLNFDLAEFSAQVENITSVTVEVNGMGDVAFTKDGTDGTGGYTLTWVYTGMNVSYLGGKVSLIARLTGPDGYAQDISVDYLVSRVVASKIVERNKSTGAVGGESFNFGTDVALAGFGRANETYTVQPYEPSTFEMPTSWQITYKRFNPDADGSFGTDSTGTDVTENVTYLRASMPAGAKVTYANAQSGVANAGDAMITLGSGQRVRIPVAVAKQPTGGTIPGEESITVGNATTGIRSTYKLPSKTKTTEGTEVVGIVWYGRVFIGSANYIVSFSVADAGSDGKITLPFVNGRPATYVLTAYVGAVVDANGKVLDWSNTGKLPTSSSQTYETFGEDVAKTGRQVPNGDHQKTLSLTVSG